MAKLTFCFNSISDNVKNNQIVLFLKRLRTTLHSYKATREQRLVALTDVSSHFPGGTVVRESACSAGDSGSIPGWGRSPREGNDNPLQYSCLENRRDRGAWWATVYRVAELDTTEAT